MQAEPRADHKIWKLKFRRWKVKLMECKVCLYLVVGRPLVSKSFSHCRGLCCMRTAVQTRNRVHMEQDRERLLKLMKIWIFKKHMTPPCTRRDEKVPLTVSPGRGYICGSPAPENVILTLLTPRANHQFFSTFFRGSAHPLLRPYILQKRNTHTHEYSLILFWTIYTRYSELDERVLPSLTFRAYSIFSDRFNIFRLNLNLSNIPVKNVRISQKNIITLNNNRSVWTTN